MYKKTATSNAYINRTADSATTPRLTAQRENVKATGGGKDQLGHSDLPMELRRQELLKEKEQIDEKIAKTKAMISNAKYQYRKSRTGVDPRLLHKWETDVGAFGRKSQEIQREIGQVRRLKAIESQLCFENEFFVAARELLHPDVFEQIVRVARSRAERNQALKNLAERAPP